MNTIQKLKLIREGKLTAEQNVKNFLAEIEKNDKKGNKINAFIEVNPRVLEEAREIDKKIKSGKAGKLAGLVIGIKANINVKGLTVSCASKVLENYTGTYDATVIEKIKKEDGLIIGMCNMDEFAAGSSGETSAFGITKNPRALDRIPGGSCSGSAAAIAAGFCDLTLGTDTGGSIRNPASHCGVYGVKPSYRKVSRYGVIDLAMSFDTIGPFANDLEGCKLLLDVIEGEDERDPITIVPERSPPTHVCARNSYPRPPTQECLAQTLAARDEKNKIKSDTEKNDSRKKFIIGIPKIEISDERIEKLIKKKIEEVVKKNGWKEKNVVIKLLDLAVQTYYPIVYVEFFSGTRKFDGRRYGKKIEEAAGPEVVRRILGGSEISKAEFEGKYYKKSLLVKKLIGEEFEKVFEEVDCLIMPTVPRLPHKFGENISVKDMYSYDTLTTPANLAGVCGISIPIGEIAEGKDKIPVGMQILCGKFQEDKLFEIAEAFG